MLTAVHFDDQVGASVCKPSTRYARIPPAPLLKKGGKCICPLCEGRGEFTHSKFNRGTFRDFIDFMFGDGFENH